MDIMDNKPLISIIVPVYNSEKYLKRCLDSIECQTLKDFECILINDGSTDNSGAILEEYSRRDPRFLVLSYQNEGVSASRNKGLDKAKGKYIGFVDSDDAIAPDMYEKLLNRMLSDGSDMVFCNFYKVDEKNIDKDSKEGLHTVIEFPDQTLTRDEAFEFYVKYGGEYVGVWDKLFRREVFNNLRFTCGMVYEDTAIFPEILYRCETISHLHEPLYYYMMNESSILHKVKIFSPKTMDLGKALIMQYRFAREKKLRVLIDFCCYRLSYRMEEWGKKAKGSRELRQKYKWLKHKSMFILYNANSWKDYSFKGKIVARIKFLLS